MAPHRGTPAADRPYAGNPRRPECKPANPRTRRTFRAVEQYRRPAQPNTQHLQDRGPSDDVVDNLEGFESSSMTSQDRVE